MPIHRKVTRGFVLYTNRGFVLYTNLCNPTVKVTFGKATFKNEDVTCKNCLRWMRKAGWIK